MTDALLVIGHGTRRGAGATEFLGFVEAVAQRFPERTVAPCFLELSDPPVIPTLDALVAEGVRSVTVAPAFLLGAGHIKNDVPAALDAVRVRHPDLALRYGAPLGVEPRVLQVLDARIAEATPSDIPADETTLLLVGRGTTDPDANADVFKIARLLYEGRGWQGVEVAFTSQARPSVPDGMARCVALGARRVIVVPLFLFTGVLVERIHTQIAENAAHFPATSFAVAPYLGGDPLLVDLLVQRVEEAESGRVQMSCDTCLYRTAMVGFEQFAGVPRWSDTLHGLRGHDHTHGYAAAYPSLPAAISPDKTALMEAAPIVYADDGSVDWGNMWETFCVLATDGGSPHRGALLAGNPVPDPTTPAYRAAVTEILRGVRAVSGLTAAEVEPGWIAISTDSPAMAQWLCDASRAENLDARTDGDQLLVPVGSQWEITDQVKSVITVVAKTTHYWAEHLLFAAGQRR